MFGVATTYFFIKANKANFKKALLCAYVLNDDVTELRMYERLAHCYMNKGDTVKMGLYHGRSFYA